MRYSLLAGGKRIRPVLALATARSIGLDPERVLPAAAALELIHTYSLIHDDLPAMDDDELRRGMPTSHVKFGENVAILAGDALFAEAMRLFTERQEGNPAAVLAALGELITGGRRGRDGRRPVHRRHRVRCRGQGRLGGGGQPQRVPPAGDALAQDRALDRSERGRRPGARRGAGS